MLKDATQLAPSALNNTVEGSLNNPAERGREVMDGSKEFPL
jgi:hypothetical protein